MDHPTRMLSADAQLEAARLFSERAKARAQWRCGGRRREIGLLSESARTSPEQSARPRLEPRKDHPSRA